MDSDGLELAAAGHAGPYWDSVQPLIYMGTSQGAEAVPHLPGKKHFTSQVFVFPNEKPGGGFLNRPV